MSKEEHNHVAPHGAEPPGVERLRHLKVVGPDEETLRGIHAFVTSYPVAYIQGFITGDGGTFHLSCLEVHKEDVTDELRQEFLAVTETACARELDDDLLAEWFPTIPAVGSRRPDDVLDFVFQEEMVEAKGFGSHASRLLVWPSSVPTDKV